MTKSKRISHATNDTRVATNLAILARVRQETATVDPSDLVDPAVLAVKRHRKLVAKSNRLYDELEERTAAARGTLGLRPAPLIAWREYSHIGGSEIDDRYRMFLEQRRAAPEILEAEYMDAKRRYQASIRAGMDWDERCGLTEDKGRLDLIGDELREAGKALANTAPTTPSGIAAIINYAVANLEDGDSDWELPAIKSAIAPLTTSWIIQSSDTPAVSRGDALQDAITRYLETEKAVNAIEKIQASPEEAAFYAAINEIETAGYVATTAPGALAALRLAQQELNNFASSGMTKALVDSAMAYFDEIEKTSGSALRDGLYMVQSFPEPQTIEGAGWAAIYDGLTCCIQTLSGISNQPRGQGDAGEYLDAVSDFLSAELKRLMPVAIDSSDETRDDGNHSRLTAAIQFLAEEADLSYNEKTAVLDILKGMRARQ